MKLLFPKQNYNVLAPHFYSYICEKFIYFQDWSAYSAAGKYVDQFWEYINRLFVNIKYCIVFVTVFRKIQI